MKLYCLLIVVVFCGTCASAQNTGTGTPPFGSLTGGTQNDVVNNQNLNVHLAMVAMSLPGRNKSMAFVQINDSQIWAPATVGGTTSWTPVVDANGNPTWGWQSVTPNGTLSYRSTFNNQTCGLVPHLAHLDNFVYTDSLGTKHRLSSASGDTLCQNNNLAVSVNAAYADDHSGYLVSLLPTSPVGAPGVGASTIGVLGPDGTQYVNTGTSNFGPVTLVEDSNGNYVTTGSVTSDNNGTTLTPWFGSDGFPPVQVVNRANGNVEYSLQNGLGPNVVITAQTISIKTNFACPGITEYSGTARVPASIAYAGGASFTFAYEPSPGNPGFSTGRLQKVTTETGAFYQYDYTGTNDGINCSDGTTLRLTRTINDGTASQQWVFTRTGNTTTITAPKLSYDPAANDTAYTFDVNGHQTSKKIYQGSAASGTLLRTMNTTWAVNGTPASNITILEDGSTQTEIDSSYDSNGLLQSLSEYDFGASSHGPLLRATSFSYVNDPNYVSPSSLTPRNLINLVSEVQIKDGAGIIRSRTHSNYDEAGTLTSCPTAVNAHNDNAFGCSYQFRGNLTSVLSYKDPVTPANPVTSTFTHDVFGNTLIKTLAGVQQDEKLFSSATSYSYPDTVKSGPPSGPPLVTNFSYNGSPAAQLSNSTDPNGQITSYGYDSLGRLASITHSGNVTTSLAYDSVGNLASITKPIDAAHSRMEVRTSDGFGRILTSSVTDQSGNVFSIVKNLYDELGRLASVSTPYTGASPSFFTSNQFDALGRITKTSLPDGQQTTSSYSLQTETVTDSSGKQVKNKTDAVGRLIELDQPNVASQGTSTNATASVAISGSIQDAMGNGGPPHNASSGSPLASVVFSDGSSHTFFVDPTQHLCQVYWNSISGWISEDLTIITGDTLVGAGSGLTSVMMANGTAHVFYLGTNQHIYQMAWDAAVGWFNQDVSALTGNTLAVPGSSLTSTTLSDGSAVGTVHVFYFGSNQHMYHMYWSGAGGWGNQDLTAITGNTLAAVGSDIAALLYSNNSLNVYYLGINQHINAIYWSSAAGWGNADLTAMAGNILAAPGTRLTSIAPPTGSIMAQVFYEGSNQHIYNTYYSSSLPGWQTQDLTGATGNILAVPNSKLTGTIASGAWYVGYVAAANQHVYTLYCCSPGWGNADLNVNAGSSVNAATGSALSSVGAANNLFMHEFYLNGSQHIYDLYYNLSLPGWQTSDLTSLAQSMQLDAGTVSLTAGGFTATACFGNSTNPSCTGQQQNISTSTVAIALAQALNAPTSPATATVIGGTINMSWKASGPANGSISPISTVHDRPAMFSAPSFTSEHTNFSGGASSWFNSPLVTTYTYNVLNRLIGVSKGTQSRTYQYDALGRQTSASMPELAGGMTNMQYNDFGLLTQSTDSRGVITTYSYDSLNRPKSVSYNVGNTGVPSTPGIINSYGTSATSFNNGRLVTMTDGAGSESYTYDNRGHKTRCDRVTNGVTYTTLFQYNLAGELTQIQYPSGRQVLPAIDGIGRWNGVSDTFNGINTSYASGVSYNVAHQITQFTYGNGVVANFGFSLDGRQQLNSLQYVKGTQNLFDLNYIYTQNGGNNGQITRTIDLVDNGRSTTYLYDALGRLGQAYTDGSAAFPKWDLAFFYDQYGNRTDETPQADTSGSATVPSNHILFGSSPQTNRITTSGYAYDANGNMTNDGINTMVYDAANQIIASNAGATSYQYDGYGLRARKCGANCGISSTVYVYVEGSVVAEYDNGAAPSAPSREYINAGGKLAKIEAGAIQYYHPDHLSTRAVTDSSGNKIVDRGHFPYGEEWYASGPPTKFQFTSYERDLTETGNDYAGARYYVSRLGRFSSPDPIDDPSLNGFGYVMNDPLNHTDSSGMVCDDDCAFNYIARMFGGQGDCTVNNVTAPCSLAQNLLDANDATVCPQNDCRYRWDPTAGFKPALRFGDEGTWQMWHPGIPGFDTNWTQNGVPLFMTLAGWWFDVSAVHETFPSFAADPIDVAMANGPHPPAEDPALIEARERALRVENLKALQEWTCEESRDREDYGDKIADLSWAVGLKFPHAGAVMGYNGLYEKYVNGKLASAIAGCPK